MSKTAKPATNAKNAKNDPKLMAMLNTAENSKRNLYIFQNQVHSTFVARELVNYLVDKCADILHSNYLMRQKMPHYLSEIYTMNIKEVVEVDKICHDINDPSNPYKRYEEDVEPLSIPMDNYMTDWIKVGQKKSIASTIESKPIEPKPPSEKKQKFGRQKMLNKPVGGQPSPTEVTNRSNNPLDRESLNSSKLVKTQRRSKSNIIEQNLPSNNKKSILRENFNRLVPIPQAKILNDEVIERFRQEQARLIEDEQLKIKEATNIADAKLALKKKIDLLEKSVFKKEYTYDFNGDIIEVKNRHPPKKEGFHMKLGFQVGYDQHYLERVDTRYAPEQGVMYEVEASKGPPVFRYKPKTYGKSAIKVVEVDEELFKYEELLRTYGLIGYGPFDPSKVTEKMLEELEKRRQENIIDYITPMPGVKIIEKERVKENTTAVPKYSESGFPLITKSVYENLQDRSYDDIQHLNVSVMNDTKDFERALMEKEKRFRKLLDGLYPPQKKLQNKTKRISEIASYLDINPLESQDIDNNINRTISQGSNKENDKEPAGTNRSGKTSNRSNMEKSVNKIKFGDGIQERIEIIRDPPRRASAIGERNASTPAKPVFSDTKKHYMEKYYGKEEIFAKRKNRQLSTASKIPRIKKPEDSDHNKSAVIGRSTEHAGASDISWVTYANKSYLDEAYDTNKRIIHDRLNVNSDNVLHLLSED